MLTACTESFRLTHCIVNNKQITFNHFTSSDQDSFTAQARRLWQTDSSADGLVRTLQHTF